MSSITNLDISVAIPLWNKFISSFSTPVPFSFNPSFFNFYLRYFHWKPVYILVVSGDKTVAVCPLVNTGKVWVSLPHFSYGGVLQNEITDIKPDNIFFQRLISFIQMEKVTSGFYKVNLDSILNVPVAKHRCFVRSTQSGSEHEDFTKTSSIIYLPGEKEKMWRRINGNLQRKINKAATLGFEIEVGGEELLQKFYGLYVRKMHSLGSPAYGKGFFKCLLETEGQLGEAKVFIALKEKKVAGVALLQSYLGFFENTWFATDKKFYNQYISDYLHWQMIQYTIEKNGKIYSFGRSTPMGSVHHYKKHWPVEDLPIYQLGRNNRIKNFPIFSSLWKKTPLFFAKPVGPLLIKHVY